MNNLERADSSGNEIAAANHRSYRSRRLYRYTRKFIRKRGRWRWHFFRGGQAWSIEHETTWLASGQRRVMFITTYYGFYVGFTARFVTAILCSLYDDATYRQKSWTAFPPIVSSSPFPLLPFFSVLNEILLGRKPAPTLFTSYSSCFSRIFGNVSPIGSIYSVRVSCSTLHAADRPTRF